MKSFQEYVERRWGMVHPLTPRWLVAVMGLAGETGEVIEPCKKHFRDGKHPGEDLKLELGDVLHYLTVIAASYGWTLEQLAEANMRKLDARDAKRRAEGKPATP
jgi:NTP pyrophosphatase (non-canonical NTP hydrolase)